LNATLGDQLPITKMSITATVRRIHITGLLPCVSQLLISIKCPSLPFNASSQVIMNYPHASNHSYNTNQNSLISTQYLTTPLLCGMCNLSGHTVEHCFVFPNQIPPNETFDSNYISSDSTHSTLYEPKLPFEQSVNSGYPLRPDETFDQKQSNQQPKNTRNVNPQSRQIPSSSQATSDFPSIPNFSLNNSLLNSKITVNEKGKATSSSPSWPSYLSSLSTPNPLQIISGGSGTPNQQSGVSPLPNLYSSQPDSATSWPPPEINNNSNGGDEMSHFDEALWTDQLYYFNYNSTTNFSPT
jgi:hypothetical protein